LYRKAVRDKKQLSEHYML